MKTFETQVDVNSPEAPSQVFRPIHYLGSKLRLLNEIGDAVNEVSTKETLVCDLFSGSGVVSSFLGLERRVVAVDIQEYARVLASSVLLSSPVKNADLSALLKPATDDDLGQELLQAFAPLVNYEAHCIAQGRDSKPEALADLIEMGSVVSASGITSSNVQASKAFAEVADRLSKRKLKKSALVSRYYGGLYFNYHHAIALDVLLSKVDTLPLDLQDLGKSIILSTASDLVRTVGKQFAQPLRPRSKDGKPKAALWRTVEKSRSVDSTSIVQAWLSTYVSKPSARSGSSAIRADYCDFLRTTELPIGVVYADPPYTRDHYSRFYHVLETMCLGDHPKLSRTNLNGGHSISRGAYREDRHQSPFCIRSQAPGAFEELFKVVSERGASLVLSYSPQADGDRVHPRVMRLMDITEIAKRHFPYIEVRRSDTLAHSKLNRTDLHLDTPEVAEVLVVCRS
ncbi:MAG: DNA adenine methylase [Flavobacteriales bacterium]|nr:DNA adenine methylase [Flavobacteriales bacterium]MBK7086054.1 DNA adenine methylase [Flavobacteriales bacterium]MBK9075307.1 DNA adenine methylase [Flavobacteriales bacterium]